MPFSTSMCLVFQFPLYGVRSFQRQDTALFYTSQYTDYGRLVRKSPSLHGRKSNPDPKFIVMTEAYFVCHIDPNFQISSIYAEYFRVTKVVADHGSEFSG